MLKLCFFSGDITRDGGTERVAINLMNGLYKTGNYQIFVVSLTEGAKDTFFKIDSGIQRYKLGEDWKEPGIKYMVYPPKLRKIMKKEQPDLIIDIDVVLDVISVLAKIGYSRVKIISWEHFNFNFENSVFYRKFIIKYFVPRADCLVTLTQGDHEAFQNNIKGIKKICHIYNPVYIDEGSGEHNKNQIVWAGHVTYEKGVDYLISVAEKVLKKHRDWQWLVLGDGEEKDRLIELVKEKGLENRLIVMGCVKNVYDYLRESKIFVLTSMHEGLPMCLLEAKANGLPCVSFNCPTGPAEIIENDVDGYLIPCFNTDIMAETIDSMISDEKLLHRLAANSSNKLELFSIDTMGVRTFF